MHFFKNSVSFIAVMCVFGVACAATTGRVGVVSTSGAMRRLPSLSNVIKATSGGTVATATTTTSSSTGTSLLSDTDCIDNYRDCMKSENACGSDFEECTTNVLFHGHMSECFSTLYQCSPDAIDKLLGTSNLSALSNVDSYVSDTNNAEVARYTYPTDGSIMGIDIIGAATRNKLSTADCVKKYKRCLNKDNICGEDFELCTSDEEFKKQAAMCDSTLARCQKEGFQQLFGEAITTKPAHKKLKPNADGDAHKWIEEGAALAAANAVNTCYKVVDTCFANACAKNPYSCVEDVDWSVVNAAQSIVVGGLDVDTVDTTRTGKQMATDVRKFFRAACTDTIGANQYCYMTFNDGKKPTKQDLQDEDLREDIFGEAYASRKTILTTKVNELVKKFDTTARNKCIETFKSCAVHSCGGGSGAACYSRVFSNSSEKSINTENNNVYSDIENGCAAVVNTDANCRHMAAMQGADTYTYEMGGTTDSFGILFPKYDGSNSMLPIVAALNADLSTSYNDAAIEQMKKQCSNVVSNCVKSMCGADYKNCYRNRNDILVSTYSTESSSFNKSMNRVGGVLDYTIVQGLCMSTVKSSDACAESLAIAKVGLMDGDADVTGTWGSNVSTVSNAWRQSGQNYGYGVTHEAMVQATDANGRKLCKCTKGGNDICGYEEGGNTDCQTAYMIEKDIQLSNVAATSLFQTVLADIELEAQAKYNAKLTHEQNVCLAQNTASGIDPAFVWAKLAKNAKRPASDYATNGLGTDGSVASNDLYNSFCRVKITIQSEDKDIQAKMKDIPNAYFSVGDPFTCGAWISGSMLDKISESVAAKKTGTDKDGALTSGQKWGVAGITALSSIVGGVGTDLLQTKTGLGGLLGTTKTSDNADTVNKYAERIGNCATKAQEVQYNAQTVKSRSAQKNDNKTAVSRDDIDKLRKSISELQNVFSALKVNLNYTKYNWATATFNRASSLSPEADAGTVPEDIITEARKVEDACNDMLESQKMKDLKDDKDKNFWNNGGGRAVMDVAGAAVLGTAGGITTTQIMKANNRAEFTAEQQKWMESIGSKIHCYVGGQMVGDFGDIVSIDIDED